MSKQSNPRIVFAERCCESRCSHESGITNLWDAGFKVEDAKSVLVLKRGKGKGFSAVENELFVGPQGINAIR